LKFPVNALLWRNGNWGFGLEPELLSSLIGDIYDAALDPGRWRDALRKCVAFTGGVYASIYSKDLNRDKFLVSYDSSADFAPIAADYGQKFVRLDPTTSAHFFADIGAVMSTEDVIPWQEFVETRFYKEFAEPAGFGDTANVLLDRYGHTAMLFVVFRSRQQGRVDDEMRRRMHLIAPHVRRAALIGDVIEQRTIASELLSEALDGLRAAFFLVGSDGSILHANASGLALLNDRSVLHSPLGRLTSGNDEATQLMRDAFAAAGHGDRALGERGLAIPLDSNGARYLLNVLPLTSGARRAAARVRDAVAAVFVHRAELAKTLPPEAIARSFRLTPSELRVLMTIVTTGNVAQTAEALGIAESTVRTHLHRLFAKTGASRQADLVKIVAGFTSPLFGGADDLAARQ
jgi:DNA-binding CsgD family transcriptional regulator